MIKLKVINTLGKEVGEIEVCECVFGQEYNEALIHQIVVAQLANKRQGTKSTLTRTEVRGGGIKPWRQKGTGRARQGSIRAPQWIKGGVVFAPKPRDFSKKVNKKMKDAGIKCVLSEMVRNNDIIVIDSIALENAKTKEMAMVLKNLSIEKRAILVLDNEDASIVRASKNLPNLVTANVTLVNVYDLLRNGKCIITKDAIKMLEEVYA